MTKRGQIQAVNGEFQLSQPILHRIQSFLTAKEAARTTILSKSWCTAWLTRPNLDFVLQFLRGDDFNSKFDKFSELAKKTIQRYEQSNLKIESLSLGLRLIPRSANIDSEGLANDLITRALKIGATHLNLQLHRTCVLPHEVFEAENLVELSVGGCKIDNLGFGRKVRCSKLESLSLCSVEINSEMISNIASNCPLIWKLSLYNVSPFNDDDRHVYYSFLGDLSSIFPSLKDLTLGCETLEVSRVSSRSLERLHFATEFPDPMSNVKFDIPSIRKFSFDCDDVPSLSFVSAPREWESDVFITDTYENTCISTLWFRKLNKFLTESSLSRIYLTLRFDYYDSSNYEVGDIRGLPKPKVENLTIKMICLNALSCFALFHGLFQICRPKFITLDKMGFGEENRRNCLLCKTLARGLDDKWIYGLHDLEKVNVHLFGEDVDAWRPLPFESFLDPSISPKGNKKTRFQFKWKT